MRKLLILLLSLFLSVAMAEGEVLSIQTPAEAIRPGKAFLLTFTVPEEGECTLALRDMNGQPVLTVVEMSAAAGTNQLWWNGTANGTAAAEGV